MYCIIINEKIIVEGNQTRLSQSKKTLAIADIQNIFFVFATKVSFMFHLLFMKTNPFRIRDCFSQQCHL